MIDQIADQPAELNPDESQMTDLPVELNLGELEADGTGLDEEEAVQSQTARDICSGLAFDDLNAAVAYVVENSLSLGYKFVVGKSEKTGTATRTTKLMMVCECFGLPSKSSKVPLELQRNRGSKKTNCEAFVRINHGITKSQATLGAMSLVHNHEPFNWDDIVVRRQDDLAESEVEKINEEVHAKNLSASRIAQKLKSVFNKTYDTNLISNVVAKVVNKAPISEDASNLLDDLKAKQLEDPTFFHRITVDQNMKLTGVLWMTGEQRKLVELWGQVILNDSTCKSNVFGMPLNLTMVVDGYGHARSVAFALLTNETSDSYAWVLECIKEATQRRPQMICTDGDRGMDAALKAALPYTIHHLCQWHLNCNIKKNLSGILRAKMDSFWKAYHQTRTCLTQADFHVSFENLKAEYPETKEYLEFLEKDQEKWAYCYTSRIFTAGIQSTSILEGENGIMKKGLNSKSRLMEVVSELDDRLRQQEIREACTEIKGLSGSRAVPTFFVPLINVAADHLGSHIVEKLKAVVQDGINNWSATPISDNDPKALLLKDVAQSIFPMLPGPLTFFAVFNPGSTDERFHKAVMLGKQFAFCSCMKPVTHGYPCCHVFATFKEAQITELPYRSINSRWFTTASARELSIEVLPAKDQLTIRPDFEFRAEIEVKLARRDRELDLHNYLQRISSFARRENRLDEAIELLDTHFHPFLEGVKQVAKEIANPDQVKTKGRPSKRRAKSFLEKTRKNANAKKPRK